MSVISDDEWEAYARNLNDEMYLSDQEKALLRLLDVERAEVKRLRVQLGCVKALATLWEEEADKAAKELEDDLSDLSRGFTAGSARAYRVHADALRKMLSED